MALRILKSVLGAAITFLVFWLPFGLLDAVALKILVALIPVFLLLFYFGFAILDKMKDMEKTLRQIQPPEDTNKEKSE